MIAYFIFILYNLAAYQLSLPAEEILEYYQARFQIEFIFRDAKQFTGLSDCQSRSSQRLGFHFNASLIALNLAKYEAYNRHSSPEPFVFSIASYKRREFNRHLLYTFIVVSNKNETLSCTISANNLIKRCGRMRIHSSSL
jgi:hypothetical protein